MRRKLKNLLGNIQNSDEKTKKRWLIGASAISIILVIGLWFVYINFTTKPLGENTSINEPTVGFWQIFKNGLTIVFQSVKEKVEDVFLEITKSRTIIIE
jgi:hypothetical protein